MSIASELTRLQNAKAAIKQSLENKGATIDSSATLSDYPSIIDNLPSGGDNSVLKDLIERDITSIEIPEGTTKIGKYMFFECSYLTSVTIPNTVTYIHSNAFNSCTSLKNIVLPENITNIDNYAFENTAIELIELPESALSIHMGIFKGCEQLTTVKLPSKLNKIDDVFFSGCKKLTTVSIPQSVTSIGNTSFLSCSSLQEITIPLNVTNLGSLCFRNCSSLQSITIEATTPPTLSNKNAFDNTNNCPIYVPCESVQAYKTATNWSAYADRITCVGGADEPNNTVKLVQGGCYSGGAESAFTYDLDGSGVNYTITGFEIAADEPYYIRVRDANDSLTLKELVSLNFEEDPTIKAGDTVTLIEMPYNVQGTDIDTWNLRGIYFGFYLDSGVTTLKVTIDTTNNTYTLKAL